MFSRLKTTERPIKAVIEIMLSKAKEDRLGQAFYKERDLTRAEMLSLNKYLAGKNINHFFCNTYDAGPNFQFYESKNSLIDKLNDFCFIEPTATEPRITEPRP